MLKTQEYLDKNYPKEERKRIEKLDLSNKNLGGTLDLSDFVNLKELDCSENRLRHLIFPYSTEKLETIILTDNCFNRKNLTFFSRLINLKKLEIGNHNKTRIESSVYNAFTGSLKGLENLSKLE